MKIPRTMKRLMSIKGCIAAISVLCMLGICIVAFFAGDTFALNTLTIRTVTPDRLADAMQHDTFYSEFREDTLIIYGQVSYVTQNKMRDTIVFWNHGNFRISCELLQKQSLPSKGEQFVAVSEGYAAQRLKSGVLLMDCVLLAK